MLEKQLMIDDTLGPAVVVAKSEEWSLPTTEICSSNLVTRKFYWNNFFPMKFYFQKLNTLQTN